MRKLLLLLLLTSSMYATEYAPWFSPLWEFQRRVTFAYQNEGRVQTPEGSFTRHCDDYTYLFSLGLTPWPYWNVELELALSNTCEIPISYQAALLTVRYQWMDELDCDPITLTTGLTLSVPGNRYQRNFTFLYPGHVNGEVHLTAGKQWCLTHVYALAGFGIADQGNGWLHGKGVVHMWPLDFFIEGYYGLGPNDIQPNERFKGYSSIAYRTVDVGGSLTYDFAFYCSLKFTGWVNVYARNFTQDYWGLAAELSIPFGL